jgi:hypothetical protein
MFFDRLNALRNRLAMERSDCQSAFTQLLGEFVDSEATF